MSKLLEEVRDLIRTLHYSYRTEEAYLHWIRQYILFHGKRHPAEMGAAEVSAFLTHLAVKRQVAASTQNQALAALLFLYKNVLKEELPWLKNVERAKRPARIPLVLTRAEVKRLLTQLGQQNGLQASLLYGAGLRLRECLSLRVKDLDFDYQQIAVRDAKGHKDRVTMLPTSAAEALKTQLANAKGLHLRDLADGFGRVYLPFALARKYPHADREWGWQDVFPAAMRSRDPLSGTTRRHHVGEWVLQKAIKMLCGQHKLTSRQVATLCVTVLPHTCWRTAMTFDRSGVVRSQGRPDHDDLHTRSEPRWPGCKKSARQMIRHSWLCSGIRRVVISSSRYNVGNCYKPLLRVGDFSDAGDLRPFLSLMCISVVSDMSPKQLVQLAFARAVKVQARPTSMIVHSMIVPEGSWSMPQQRCHGMLQLKWDILEELCAGPRISTAMLKVLSYVTTFAF